jgi:4-amino-4-deoxy-L-arabinose transferase-like glycosyltransferase
MPLDDVGARRWIILAAAAGLLLRLAFGLLYWIDKPLTHDEHEYLSLARGVASGQGFVYDDAVEVGTGQRFGRAPGYPLFLAALDAGRPVPDTAPVRVKAAQALVGAAIVWMIGVLALRSAGARAAVVASAMAAAYPPLVFISGYVLSETIYSAAALATAIVLQRAADRAGAGTRAGRAWAIGGGALAGAAALIRPAMLAFLPLAFLWFLRRGERALAVAMVAAAVLVIAPWTLRNLRVYDRFVLIASEGGVTFWTGNHPLARGEGDLASNPDLKRAELAFRNAHRGLSAEEMEPLYYRAAFGWIAEHPIGWAGLVARKAYYTIVPTGPSYALHSTRYRIASSVPYLLVLPFALLGMQRLWVSGTPPMTLFLLAASSVLVGLIFLPQERFRIPVIDPTLIISAAALAGRSGAR